MKDFIEVISAYIKAYREANSMNGSRSGDLRVAREYYKDKMTDPELTLKTFLDEYYGQSA